MPKKQSVSTAVRELLEARPYFNDLFAAGAVNYSGLARHLEPMVKERLRGEKFNLEAITMAIIRYEKSAASENISEQIMKNIANFSLSMRSDLTEISLVQTPDTHSAALKVAESVDWSRGETLNVFQSTGEISILIDERNSALIFDGVGESEILHVEKGLAMLIVNTPEKILDTPGIFYHLTGIIARNNITLVDMDSTFTKLTFIVHERDAAKTYQLLFSEIKRAREMVRGSVT